MSDIFLLGGSATGILHYNGPCRPYVWDSGTGIRMIMNFDIIYTSCAFMSRTKKRLGFKQKSA